MNLKDQMKRRAIELTVNNYLKHLKVLLKIKFDKHFPNMKSEEFVKGRDAFIEERLKDLGEQAREGLAIKY